MGILPTDWPRWPPVLGYLLSPAARHANDQSAAAEVNWSRHDDAWPAGLELQWLGTAGFRLSYEGAHLYIDPYLTRPPLGPLLRARSLRPSPERIFAHVPAADAVVVGHTHFDHALDVPAICARYRCPAFGSPSLARLMALHGVPELAREVEIYRTYSVGPFELTFVPSVHSKLTLGLRIPMDGELTCDHLDHLGSRQYKCGQVYGIHIAVAGVSFYHQGSADLIDDAIRHRGVDYFLCGLAGRGYTRDYMKRVLSRLEPRVVVAQHHDNFMRPLDAPMGFSINVNFGKFVDEVRAVSPDFAVRALELLQTRGAGAT